MSHVTKIDINITDLAALRAAAIELGAEWREGQKTYEWFGRTMGDYPLPEGFTQEDLGKCEHAIRVPGSEYEIGVVKKKDGSGGYTLLWDYWSPLNYKQRLVEKIGDDEFEAVVRHDGVTEGGQLLHRRLGVGLGRLKQFYGIHKATSAARALGHMVQRKQVGKSIKLVVTGV